MQLLTTSFWLGAVAVCYTYIFYPLLISLMAKRWPRRQRSGGPIPAGISIIIAARNEHEHIERRLKELISILSESKYLGEIILISDGSTDETVSIARSFGDKVSVVDWQVNRGKAAALNFGVSLAKYDIVVFADSRQRWAVDAVDRLQASFQDPSVGAVSGELLLESNPGVLSGVGMYWKFEKWLRSRESAFHSQIGVTGAICAVRRDLYRAIPEGILLDDVYWPMQVALQEYRVIYQPEAKAFDHLPEHSAAELQRKLRTLVGNFQLIAACPSLLVPWSNPLWWQFVSHKVMRLVAPWALLVTLISSGFLAHPFYQAAFVFQLLGICAGVFGLVSPLGTKSRVFSAAGSFLLLHLAAWLAFWYWILGHANKVWSPSTFHLSPVDQS